MSQAASTGPASWWPAGAAYRKGSTCRQRLSQYTNTFWACFVLDGLSESCLVQRFLTRLSLYFALHMLKSCHSFIHSKCSLPAFCICFYTNVYFYLVSGL